MSVRLKRFRTYLDIKNKITIISSKIGANYTSNITSCLKEHEVILNCDIDIAKKINTDIILIGNLADNNVCKHLYHKMIISTDLRYPGGNEFEIRTLVNPFGNGNNILHIGYSTESGLQKAIKKFKELTDNVDFIERISFSNSKVLPIDIESAIKIKNSAIPSEDIIYSIHTSYWWLLGYFAYLEDDKLSYRKYEEGFSLFKNRAKKIPKLGTNMHLHMVQHVVTIWVLDNNGYFADNERKEVFNVLYNWANSDEGVGYIKSHGITGKTVCHNHTLFCALALKILSELFKKSCEFDKSFDIWNDMAELCYSSFNRGGWKPLCDDSAYSVEITLVLASIYSLFEDKHRFLNNGGYKAKEWLKAIVRNDTCTPSFGDGTASNPSATVLIKIFSYWYKDEELYGMFMKLPEFLKYRIAILCHQNYDIGLSANVELSQEVKLDIIKTDEEIYYCYDKSVEEAKHILEYKPTYDINDCFDKISIRNKKIHMLIDGISSPYVHAYHDGGGLIEFSLFDVTWLVEENCYRWPETEHCNMITITKDAKFEEPAPMVKLVKTKQYEKATYVQVEIDDYNGCCWNREYILLHDYGLIIRDIIKIKEDNDYTICFHCKTPGIGELENNEFIVNRVDKNNNKHKMIIKDYDNLSKSLEIINIGELLFMCGGVSDESKTFNHGSFSSVTGIKSWEYKYNESSMCASHLESRISGNYLKGENITMTHSFMIDCEFSIDINEDQLIVEKYNEIIKMSILNEESDLKVNNNDILSVKSNIAITNQIDDVKIIDGLIYNEYTMLLLENNIVEFYLNNQKINRVIFDIKISTLCNFNDKFIIGNIDGFVFYYTVSGELIFKKQLIRIESIYATWETNHFEVTSLSQVDNNKESYLAVGTGDNQVKLLNENGEMIWTSYIYATIPNKIFNFDIENDGEKEIITIGSESMNAGCLYNFKFDGKENRFPRIGGWLNNIIDIAYNKELIVCGLKYGKNLIAFKREKSFKIIFEKNLGGKVNGVDIFDDNIIVITSKGYLLKYTLNGERKKLVDLKGSANKMKIIDDYIIIETNNGVSIYNMNFDLCSQFKGYKIMSKNYIYNKECLVKITLFN